MKPAISIVMSAWNAERYLPAAIESLLNQTFSDFELILIDDGSSDATYAISNDFRRQDPRIVLVRTRKNIGQTGSLNRGLALARGEFIARQDADDISYPHRLHEQMKFLKDRACFGLLGSSYDVIDSQGRKTATHRHPTTDLEIRWKMVFHNPFCHSSVIFRQNLRERVACFYDPALSFCQDYDFWSRLLQNTTAANLSEPLVAVRLHSDSVSRTHEIEQQKISFSIAAKKITALAPQLEISEDQIHTLRRWYHVFPERMDGDEIGLSLRFLQLLEAFLSHPLSDKDEACRLRQKWVSRVFSAVTRSDENPPGLKINNLQPLPISGRWIE